MLKIQIGYVTWGRSDANGLFDYQQLKDKKPSDYLIIQQSGYIFRRKDNYNLQFCRTKMDQSKFQKILKVTKQNNHFIMSSLKLQNQPFFKIIGQKYPKTHLINKNDILRFGKVTVEIIELKFNHKQKISPYELIKQEVLNTKLTYIRQITPAFYGNQGEQSICNNQNTFLCQSSYEQNPTCRYCYSKTVTLQNPFLVSCGCMGSSRYIHEKCLLEWLLKKGHLQQNKNKNIIYAQQKLFKCELCHQLFYVPQIWKKMFQYQKNMLKNLQGNVYQQFMILHVKYQTNWIYIVNLAQNTDVSIGRSLQNDIVLNQLSVSRQHAQIKIDAKQKRVILSNNKAKFGTLVQIQKIEIQNNVNYQIGRTKMNFKKIQQKSFFQKIGIFCFVSQKIKNQTRRPSKQQKQQLPKQQNQLQLNIKP